VFVTREPSRRSRCASWCLPPPATRTEAPPPLEALAGTHPRPASVPYVYGRGAVAQLKKVVCRLLHGFSAFTVRALAESRATGGAPPVASRLTTDIVAPKFRSARRTSGARLVAYPQQLEVIGAARRSRLETALPRPHSGAR